MRCVLGRRTWVFEVVYVGFGDWCVLIDFYQFGKWVSLNSRRDDVYMGIVGKWLFQGHRICFGFSKF